MALKKSEYVEPAPRREPPSEPSGPTGSDTDRLREAAGAGNEPWPDPPATTTEVLRGLLGGWPAEQKTTTELLSDLE